MTELQSFLQLSAGYTSNIFAVLGLRAMYFALAAMIERFAYLKHTLALILAFIGAKTSTISLAGMCSRRRRWR
jgi:predicted tellurium resistance membrane protein TerC